MKKQKIIEYPDVSMTPKQIEDFLKALQKKGRQTSTVESYRRSLHALYQALPEKKELSRRFFAGWQKSLTEQGDSVRTVNAKTAAVNSFLAYLGRRELQLQPLPLPEDVQPELTRAEYLRLLQMAKAMKKERTYLLIKLIACTGASVQDVAYVTMEALADGQSVVFTPGGSLYIFPTLQKELLCYAKRQGIRRGPLFLTRKGSLIDRSNITRSIKCLCKDAKVPEEKATPLCLRKLYQATYAGIRENMDILVEQAYTKLLEKEERSIGWEV